MTLKQIFRPTIKKIIIYIIVTAIIYILAVSISGAGMIPPVGSFIFYPIIALVIIPPFAFYYFLSKFLPDTLVIPLSWLLGIIYIYIIFCLVVYIFDKIKKLWKEKPIVKPVLIGLVVILIIVIAIKIPADIERVKRRKRHGPAPDASIIRDLGQVRDIAEIIRDKEGSYISLCDDSNTLNDNHSTYGEELRTIEIDIMEKSPEETLKPVCFATDKSYCISAKLNWGGPEGKDYYCVDGTLFRRTNSPCISANGCPD